MTEKYIRSLFEASSIGGMTLSNRFVRSATWEGLAGDDGAVTPALLDVMSALAGGGVGLIISSHAFVRTDGQAGPWQLGAYADRMLPGLRQMTTAVHENGGKIVLQLAHAGNFAFEKLTGETPVVASAYEGLADSPRRELGREDIRQLVQAFAAAAGRARAAGFDGVQIHSAHGYLLSQFLSPLFNRRRDEYGGQIANRVRIHLEILQAIRETVGKDYPVLAKMNCRDFKEGGLSLEDSLRAGAMLVEAGLDAIELSGGLLTSRKFSPSRTGIDSIEKEAYFRQEAVRFKKTLDVPLILVGGIRSYEVAERIVADKIADYVSMSRPLIREPGLINRWSAGNRGRAVCNSDNLCFGPARKGRGIYCVTAEREK
jgi:2,4-dienoyl-CoA reductase-like NADH-dependent reductase (Old Yellow Enzyme family)